MAALQPVRRGLEVSMKELEMMQAKAARLSDQRLGEEITRLDAAIAHPDTQPREESRHRRRRDVYEAELIIRATVRRQQD